MPLESLEFRISLQRLLAALIIVLLPLTIFGLYIAVQADGHVREMNGAHFRTITRAVAMTTSEFINERVQDIGVIANEPSVVAEVRNANLRYGHLRESQIQAKTDAIERDWNGPASDGVVKPILNSTVADLLRRHRDMNGKLLRVTVVDETGATVAATDKPSQYLQTDRDYWRALYSRGKIAAYVTDVRYDEQTRLNYISISFPVLQQESGRFIGAVNALVDVNTLFEYLDQQQVARTGHLLLVKDDGTVVSGPGIKPAMRVKSEEYAAARDALNTAQGREAGYLEAVLPNRLSYIIGFADTGLRQAFPNLGWIVIASQEQVEAMGPARNLAQFAMIMLALSVLMLAVLSAYIFGHRAQKITDLENLPDDKTKVAAA